MFKHSLKLALLLLLSSCGGYQWVAPEALLPPSSMVHAALRVPLFANDTAEPLLTEQVSGAVQRHLLAAGITLHDGGGPELIGRIRHFSDEVLAFDSDGVASHRRVLLSVQLRLVDGVDVRWSRDAVVGSAAYVVAADPTTNRDAKERAVSEAASEIADTLLLLLSDEPSDG